MLACECQRLKLQRPLLRHPPLHPLRQLPPTTVYRQQSPHLRSCWRHYMLLISRLGEEVQLPLRFRVAAFSKRCLIFPRIISADWDFCAVFDGIFEYVHTFTAMRCSDRLLSDANMLQLISLRYHGAVTPLKCSYKFILFYFIFLNLVTLFM